MQFDGTVKMIFDITGLGHPSSIPPMVQRKIALLFRKPETSKCFDYRPIFFRTMAAVGRVDCDATKIYISSLT